MIIDRLSRTGARGIVLLAAGVIAVMFGHGAQAGSRPLIDFVEIEGWIDTPTARYLERMIASSEQRKAEAMILRLDTRGALGVSVKELADRLADSRVPVVVWIAPSGAEARSGGAFLAVAGDLLVMSPGSFIGPALPADLRSGGPQGGTEAEERLLGSLASEHGMGSESALQVLNRKVGASEAVSSKLADFVAGSDTLFDKLAASPPIPGANRALETKDVTVVSHKMSIWERTLHAAVDPEVAFSLMLLGSFGLIFELYHPGLGAAAVFGAGALALSVWALAVLPTQWAGVALMSVAVTLCTRDLHLGRFGSSSLAGLALLVAGGLTLFRSSHPELQLSPIAVVAAVPVTLLFFVSVMTAAIRARLARPAPGAERLVGGRAVARTDIAPEGEIDVDGASWRARTTGAAIARGSAVTIRSVAGLVLFVEASPVTNGHNELRPGSEEKG